MELDIKPEVSRRGLQVRTVEAPFFRRVKLGMGVNPSHEDGVLLKSLIEELDELVGPLTQEPDKSFMPTRDRNGVIFVAYNGDIYPSGFLPIRLGNVRKDSIVEIYRKHPLLESMRRGEFKGRCGLCEYKLVCGGSRARAFSFTGDPLESDPSCIYEPY